MATATGAASYARCVIAVAFVVSGFVLLGVSAARHAHWHEVFVGQLGAQDLWPKGSEPAVAWVVTCDPSGIIELELPGMQGVDAPGTVPATSDGGVTKAPPSEPAQDGTGGPGADGATAAEINTVLSNTFHETVEAIGNLLSSLGFSSATIAAIGDAFTSFGNDVADFFTDLFG